jgi:hypothetical protein
VIVLDKPEAEYHADRSTLSSTGAKTLLHSPQQYRHELDEPMEPTPAMVRGTLTHALVLGTTTDLFTVKDWDGRTKEGRAAAAYARGRGHLVIDRAEWDLARTMAEAVHRNALARELLSEGVAEASLYGEDPATGVAMRGRIDWWRNDNVIVDLKTAAECHPDQLPKIIAQRQYHLQAAWYADLAALNGRPLKEYWFVFVRSSAPHQVTVKRLGERALEAGRRLAERARVIFRDCTDAEELFGPHAWPAWGTPDDGEPIELPRWALTEAEELAWL